MIISFADKDTERVYHEHPPKKLRLPEYLLKKALDKLRMLDLAESLTDLRLPPSNRLEALKGDRKGTHSIRINDQWRICFRFDHAKKYDVEIIDYH